MLRPAICRAHRRQRNRLDAGEIELARPMIDIEPDHVAIGVEIDYQALDNLTRLSGGTTLQFDAKTVLLGRAAKSLLLTELRSKNELWTVCPFSGAETPESAQTTASFNGREAVESYIADAP
jgi:hypothetical protein